MTPTIEYQEVVAIVRGPAEQLIEQGFILREWLPEGRKRKSDGFGSRGFLFSLERHSERCEDPDYLMPWSISKIRGDVVELVVHPLRFRLWLGGPEDPEAPAAYLAAARHQAAGYHNERALALVERGLAIAGDGGDRHALACRRGDLLHDLGRIAESIEVFQWALDVADNDEERCQAWTGLAALLVGFGLIAPAGFEWLATRQISFHWSYFAAGGTLILTGLQLSTWRLLLTMVDDLASRPARAEQDLQPR